jgi:predicted Zn-dependent protease
VTAEAVDGDSGIGVTALAKTVFAEDTMRFWVGMAIHAIGQAESAGADALMDRLVALVQDEFHVIPAHHRRRRYAFVAVRDVDDRQRNARSPVLLRSFRRLREQNEQARDEQYKPGRMTSAAHAQ